jgi:hypothetical protein
MYTTIDKSFPAVRAISQQLRWPRSFLASIFILSCVVFSQLAHAVSPPPDGGYATGNTAEGTNALFSLATNLGFNETALGYQALYSDTNGNYNTAVGWEALFKNNGGGDNTAVGAAALFNNTRGIFNTAVGLDALYGNTTGRVQHGLRNERSAKQHHWQQQRRFRF